jgi:hypothetical protein
MKCKTDLRTMDMFPITMEVLYTRHIQADGDIWVASIGTKQLAAQTYAECAKKVTALGWDKCTS